MSQYQSQICPVVELVNNRPATTSLKIAECFDKAHDRVLKDIRKLVANCPKEFSAVNFDEAEYKDEQGKPRPMYVVYFDGFMLLVMGYTGKKALTMKLAYIGAFNAMREKLENAAKNELPPSDAVLTPDQQCTLRAIVKSKVEAISEAERPKGIYPQIWSRFNNHFRIAKYCQLPQSRLSEAIDYLVRLDIEEQKELPKPEQRQLPSGICNGKLPLDGKYKEYLDQVEQWRLANKAEFDRLYRMGMSLFEVDRLGGEMNMVCADIVAAWLEDVALSRVSVFHEMLTNYRAPVLLAQQLNNSFASAFGDKATCARR